MFFTLTAFLAGAQALPQIDRTALELQARAEALQPRRIAAQAPMQRPGPARPPVARAQTVRPGPAQSRPAASAAERRTQPRRATSGGPLDLASITTICRAAGNQDDPAGFLARLSTAYSLSDADSSSLRASCAAYLAGRADARRGSGGTY